MALGRRAAADHRDQPRDAGQAARVRRAARGQGTRRARVRGRLRPQADPEGDRRRGGGERAPALRGPVRDAVHRDHRAGGGAPGQRAVRGPRAGCPRPRAPRATGHRGSWPRSDPRHDRGCARWCRDRPRRRRARVGARRRRRRLLGGGARRRVRRAGRRAGRRVGARARRPRLGRARGQGARGSGPGPPRRRSGRLARGRLRARPAWRLRAPLRAPGSDRDRARVDAGARGPRDGAAVGRRPARRRAWRQVRCRGAERSPAAVRDRLRGHRPGLRPRGSAGGRGDAGGCARRGRRTGAGRDQFGSRASAALRGRRHPGSRSARDGAPRPPRADRWPGPERGSRGGQPARRGWFAAPRLPRGALRPRGDLARRRRRPRGRLAPGPRRLHPVARASRRRRAAPLQRRPAGADRAHRGRVRGRAPALAGGVHREQRQLGAGGATALLPPSYAPVPNPQDRGADRARSEPGNRPDRALAGAESKGAGQVDRWRSDGDQGGRVPRRDHADRRPRAVRAGPRRDRPVRRRRGQRDLRRRLRGPGRADRSGRADGVRRSGDGARCQGAAARGGVPPQGGSDPVHVPPPRPGAGTDPGAVREPGDLRRLRDGRGPPGPAAAARPDVGGRRARSPPRPARSCSSARLAAAGSCSAASRA